jgi:hypothetical protein
MSRGYNSQMASGPAHTVRLAAKAREGFQESRGGATGRVGARQGRASGRAPWTRGRVVQASRGLSMSTGSAGRGSRYQSAATTSGVAMYRPTLQPEERATLLIIKAGLYPPGLSDHLVVLRLIALQMVAEDKEGRPVMTSLAEAALDRHGATHQ